MSTQLGDNINITADPATNSLIIAASKIDYERIRSLLAQIDVKRRQALVEATLLEVSIDHSIRTSTSFLALKYRPSPGATLVRIRMSFMSRAWARR